MEVSLHPITLDLQPFVDDFARVLESLVPLVDAIAVRPFEGAEGHGLGQRDLLVEQGDVRVHVGENARAGVAVVHDGQVNAFPRLPHLVQRGFDAELLGCGFRDLPSKE